MAIPFVNTVFPLKSDDSGDMENAIPSNTFITTVHGKKYLAEYITREKVEEMKKQYELIIPTRESNPEMKKQSNLIVSNKESNYIIKGHGTGYIPPSLKELENLIGKISLIDVIPEAGSPKFGDSADISTEIYFPVVGDQGSQGSCTAWANAYYAYGYMEAKDYGWDASSGNTDYLLSPAWVYNKVAAIDYGSAPVEVAQLMIDWGVSTLTTMPYNDADVDSWGDEPAWREAPYHRPLNYNPIIFSGPATIDTIKGLLDSGIPVTFGIDAYQFYGGGFDDNWILSSDEYEYAPYNLNHAQCFVGYDDAITDDGDIGAFKVVNSWGTTFADNGFYWLTFDAFSEFAADPYQAILYYDDRIDYNPSLISTWEFSAAPTRMDDIITLGVGLHESPFETIIPLYDGDGVNLFPDFMALDISEFQSYYDADPEVFFFLEIGSSTTTGTISSFLIERYIGGVLQEISPESQDVPKDTPGYVYGTFMIPDHELSVSLEVPTNPEIDDSYIINATVFNKGLNDEYDVDLLLYLDDVLVNSTTISTLPVGANETISYLWTPSEYKTYNFTAYAPPVPDESFTGNNIVTKLIIISLFKVAILNANEVPTYFYGGWSNNYQSIYNGLIAEGINTIVITNEDILSGILSDVGVLILIDNVPNDAASLVVKDWALYGGGIISFDSSICFLNWAGLLPPEAEGMNGYEIYWDYGSPSQGVVVSDTHPVMSGYSYGETIYGTSGDAEYYSDIIMSTSAGPYYEPLVKTNIGSNLDLVVALDAPYSGKVIHVWDYAHWNTITNQLMILNAIEWVPTVNLEHDLRVSLETPVDPQIGNSYMVNATVTNNGLNDEYDVDLLLYLDDVVVNSTTISYLPVGASETISYIWIPPDYGSYNFTAYAPPVPDESFTGNNIVTKLIYLIETKLFDGMFIDYDWTIFGEKMSAHFEWSHISGSIYHTDWYMDSDYDYWDVDAQTRVMSNSGGSGWYFGNGFHTPLWIFTEVSIGDQVLIAVDAVGDHLFEVSSEFLYELPGFGFIEVWELEDLAIPGGIAWYEKSTGILLNGTFFYIESDPYYNYTFEFINTNVEFNYISLDHELKVTLEVPSSPDIGYTYTINATVTNIGLNNEYDVELFLYLDENEINSTTISTLSINESKTITYTWTPTEYRIYNFTAFAPPVVGESYIANNIVTKLIRISFLRNYIMIPNTPYNWIDASGGTELILYDDDYAAIALPFNFPFYNDTFSIVYLCSNGYLSFTDSMPMDFVNVPFPSDNPDHTYMIAPFWDDLDPWYGGNIYVESFETYWVAEWLGIYHISENLVGSFEVILYETGEIVFNYDYLDYTSGGYTCGLNLGVDTNYYNSYLGLSDTTDDFAINFTYEQLEHDLSVSLETPVNPQIGVSYMINATVTNNGLNDESDVELLLYLDGVVVDSTSISVLPIGASETITYIWTPIEYKTYNFTAYSPPLLDEPYQANNLAIKILLVREFYIFDGMYIDHIFEFTTWHNNSHFSYSYFEGDLFYENWQLGYYNFTWLVDSQTRIMSAGSIFGDGAHTPIWIFTDVVLGDEISIGVLGMGDHLFEVTNELIFDLPSFGLVEVWELEDLTVPGGIAWYEKNTGILLNGTFFMDEMIPYYNYTFEFVDTNVDFTSLTIISPGSSSSWEAGTSQEITWISIGSISDVKIELYKDGVSILEIVASTTNDGSYSWAIPSDLEDGSDYQIKISDVSNPDIDDFSEYFEIYTPDSITITSPGGLTAWEMGTSQNITWTSTGTISDVKIELYKDGVLVMEIIASTNNDGSYTWDIPTDLEDGIDYQIKISDVANPDTYDESPNFVLTSEDIPGDGGIPSYNLYILIGLICIVSVILIKKRFKIIK